LILKKNKKHQAELYYKASLQLDAFFENKNQLLICLVSFNSEIEDIFYRFQIFKRTQILHSLIEKPIKKAE